MLCKSIWDIGLQSNYKICVYVERWPMAIAYTLSVKSIKKTELGLECVYHFNSGGVVVSTVYTVQNTVYGTLLVFTVTPGFL